MAGAVAVPGAVLVELEAWCPVFVERAVDLPGAVGGEAGQCVDVLGGRDRQQQPVDLAPADSPRCRRVDFELTGRVIKPVDQLVQVVPAPWGEFDELNAVWGASACGSGSLVV